VHKLGVSNIETLESGHLAADAKLLDKVEVCLTISFRDVSQQTAALTYHLQKPTAGHVVVLVYFEVLSQLFDSLGQNRHLSARAACIILVCLRAFNSGSLLLS
jgi:hypothetical protein